MILGIGDWGLGIGDWGLGPIPNPQSPIPKPQTPKPPIPNPQSPIPNPHILFNICNKINKYNLIYIFIIEKNKDKKIIHFFSLIL
jgi:hypothetical protein